MQSGTLTAIIVSVVVIAAAAILFSFIYYLLHKRAKKKLADTEAEFSARLEAERLNKKNKKNWKDRITTRKTIRFMSPHTQGELRTQAVQPDASKSGIKINQKLGYQQDPQKQPLLPHAYQTGMIGAEEIGALDGAMYNPMAYYSLEHADNLNTEPTNKNRNLGSIVFALRYDFEVQNLEIRVVRCWKLPAKDLGGTSDPYVRAIITPYHKKYVLETKKKMKELNPEWRETFHFEGFPLAKLQRKTLVLQVLDFDMFSKDDPIGEVEVQLGELNFYQPNEFHLHLSPCTGDRRGLGDILVSLNYNNKTSQLTVIIVKARNLKSKDINGLSDPYVKVYLLYQCQRIEKKKTQIIFKDLNPVYEESLTFSVTRDKIKDSGIHVVVNDYDKWGANELIGELVLSSRSGTQEIKHWNETVYRPNQTVSEWHALKKLKESRYLRTSSSTKPP